MKLSGRNLIVSLNLLVLISAVNIIIVIAAWSQSLAEQYERSRSSIAIQATHLAGQLEKFAYLPELMSRDPRVTQLLSQPKNRQQLQQVNDYFFQMNNILHTSDIYLMDSNGLTLAASNWQQEKTFIGRNFSYRPYFQQAIQGKPGRYHALGSTSKQRGYYFSYPVHSSGQIAGVVVVKVSVDDFERYLTRADEEALVVDNNQIIFMSTRSGWRYRSLSELSDSTREQLRLSGQYPGIQHERLGMTDSNRYGDDADIIRMDHYLDGDRILFLKRELPAYGWHIYTLTPLQAVFSQMMTWVIIANAILLVLILLAAVIMQRRRQEQHKLQQERLAQEQLQQAYAQLETMVEERTQDLRHEVDERTRAETALRLAQDSLVQAGKLAVLGEMSAGISHELNQPLAAIQTYADNAKLLLERENYAAVHENLTEISVLISRMAQISKQLKQFARQSDGQSSEIYLHQIFDVVMKIVGPQIQKTRTQIQSNLDETTQVRVDPVRMEQVLVNLLGNAIHAMEDNAERQIDIAISQHAGRVAIAIHDNGPGIAEENLSKIFDPFFTTRKSGLGLGLAITQHIIETMNGKIQASNHDQGGAIFTVEVEAA